MNHDLEDIDPVRVVVLLTKMAASAYVVAAIGQSLIYAALRIGGFG